MFPSLPSIPSFFTAPALRFEVESKEALGVRDFSVDARISTLFAVSLTVTSSNPDVDLGAIVGYPASFEIDARRPLAANASRKWHGVVSDMELLRAEDDGLATYRVVLVPKLWLLSQRRNHRVFQQMSEPQIVKKMLDEWEIEHELRITEDDYKERKTRIQYAESDLAFVNRMLEDAGIAYVFVQDQDKDVTKLVLSDRLHGEAPRATPLPFVDAPSGRIQSDFVTAVRVAQRVRPGKYTLRDVDFRRQATFPLLTTATAPGMRAPLESRLERYHPVHGSLLFRGRGNGTPAADDRGATRTDLVIGERQAARRLEAKRGAGRVVTFVSSALDLAPGDVFTIGGHPRQDLGEEKRLLVSASALEGDANEPWVHRVEARFADMPFRPPLLTPKPHVQGVETAVVVGPAGEEIHTDEFGRVRVQFDWDREGRFDELSSTWVPVSQLSGGTSFGSVNLPRVGQRVVLTFLGGDPDRALVIGRVHTSDQPTPYALPALRAVSGTRSESTPRGVPVPAPGPASARSSPLGHGRRMDDGEMDEMVTNASPFRAGSPNGATHRWSGNEVTFRDTAGSELVYQQAQRDHHTVVKNDRVAVVGNNDATMVGADRLTRIRNSDDLQIGRDQTVAIGKDQTITVTGQIKIKTDACEKHVVKDTFTVESKVTELTSEQTIVLKVGTSGILMRPDYIVIQADHVFLNPGLAAFNAAVTCNVPPETAEEAALRLARQAAADQRRQDLGVRHGTPPPTDRAEAARAVLNRVNQLGAGVTRERLENALEGNRLGFTPEERRAAIERFYTDNPRLRPPASSPTVTVPMPGAR